jgi:hypothetical protein
MAEQLSERTGKRISAAGTMPLQALPDGVAYTRRDVAAIAEMAEHSTPREYRRARMMPAMYSLVSRLALSPRLLQAFQSTPTYFIERWGLGALEASAILSRHQGRIRMSMQLPEDEIARRFLRSAFTNPALIQAYYSCIAQNAESQDGNVAIAASLRRLGYDAAPAAIAASLDEQLRNDLWSWYSQYFLIVDGRRGPVLTIGSEGVLLDGLPVNNARFHDGVLTWDDEKNASSAELEFAFVPNGGDEVSDSTYVGPICHGIYWECGDTRPATENTLGKNRLIEEGGSSADNPVTRWDSSYFMYIRAGQSWISAGELIMRSQSDRMTISYGNQTIHNWRFRRDMLTWTLDSANDTAGVLAFDEYRITPDATEVHVVIGKLHSAGE